MWALEGLLAQTKPHCLITDSSFYIYHVVFDGLLKESGYGSCIIVSKYPEISHCN